MKEGFYLLLLAGLLMTGAEIFLPGGILGVVGVICLVGAMATSFFAYPAYAPYISVGMIFLLAVSLVFWARFFPRSRLGRGMTLASDGASFKGTDEGLRALLDKQGETTSDCRPGGFAKIEGRRVDVITEGGMIAKGETVKVVEVEGNRVVIRRIG